MTPTIYPRITDSALTLSTVASSTKSLKLQCYDTAFRKVIEAINGRVDILSNAAVVAQATAGKFEIPSAGNVKLGDSKILKLPKHTSLPAVERGAMVLLDGDGDFDKVYVCIKDDTDTLVWKEVSLI